MPGKYYTLRRFNSNCHIFEFNPNELRFDSTIGVPGKLERLSKINGEPAADETTYAKINGGFFMMNGKSEYLGTYVDDGLYYNPVDYRYPTLIFWKDTKKLDYNLNPTVDELVSYQRKAQFAIGVPWMLVVNGKENYIYTKQELISWYVHPWQRNPRTLVGQKADGTIVWVVVEGRKSNSPGFTIEHSSNLMLELGCTIAANLDGGGSTEMIIDGKIKNTLSGGCERAIGTALVAYKKKNTTSGSSGAPTVTTPPPTVTPAKNTGYVNCTAGLKIRTLPNTASKVLDVAPYKTTLTITGKSGEWYQVSYTNQEAYAYAAYVTLNKGASVPEPTKTGTTTYALNMRTGPSTSEKRLLCIPQGAKIMLLDSRDGWYKTTYNGVTGWCSGQYIKV